MSFVNDRFFGSDMDATTKVKLTLRRAFAKGPISESEEEELREEIKRLDPYNLSTIDIEDYTTTLNFAPGESELSSRTPFARMWTAIELVKNSDPKELSFFPFTDEKEQGKIYYWDNEIPYEKTINPYDKIVYMVGSHHYNIFSPTQDINRLQSGAEAFEFGGAVASDVLPIEQSKNDFNKSNLVYLLF